MMIYVREDQRQNRKFDPCGEAAIYCGRSTMDNRSSHVLYVTVPGRPRPTFISTNYMTFGNKCPMAKDSPNFIDHGDTVLDFPPEANVSDISSSSVDSILDQTETHYILKMTNGQTCFQNIFRPCSKWFLVAEDCKHHESALLSSGSQCICFRLLLQCRVCAFH